MKNILVEDVLIQSSEKKKAIPKTQRCKSFFQERSDDVHVMSPQIPLSQLLHFSKSFLGTH